MTLTEELDKIFKDNVRADTIDGLIIVDDKNKIKSELLALIERKLNKIVPDKFVYIRPDDIQSSEKGGYNNCIDETQQNIEKVLEENK